MEKELNIAAILKDKPAGTKLWSPIFGDCILDRITSEDSLIWAYNTDRVVETFYSDGKYDRRGECVIFPSKQMQDWSKFAWKKGDILVSNDSDCHIIFEGFSKDDYTTFEGKHWSGVSIRRYISCLDAQDTQDYHIEDDKNAAKTYINTVEERLGGKLNLETLEIEKQPEFKDGDIVHIPAYDITDEAIFIAKVKADGVLHSYIYMSKDSMIPLAESSFSVSGCLNSLRLATENERQQLFSALEKMGKRWNPDTKQIEDLPKKCEFKTFDKVLVRDIHNNRWCIDLFSYYDETSQFPYHCLRTNWTYCIPYNEETKHLLSTTDEWKG